MIRFVDVGNQIADEDPPIREFAFYNTINSQFIVLGDCDECVWPSWAEFEQCWKESLADDPDTVWPLERFRGLAAHWIKGEK